MTQYSYDEDQVRFELYAANEGEYNWLFFPGGPGCDASYLRSLVDVLQLPGNAWLVDLPGSGSNTTAIESDDFDHWFELFPRLVSRFKHPIIVGHSFGGILPMLYPELENSLEGLVILNSTPALWQEEAARYAKQFQLPDFMEGMKPFIVKPSQETFDLAIDACMPYYFPAKTLEKGRKFLSTVSFPYLAALWGQKKAMEGKFLAKWVPQEVPTLIMGAKYDCMCPFSLFQNDQRFCRDNIELLFIEEGGHFPWLENPQAVRDSFEKFTLRLASVEEKRCAKIGKA